MYSTQSVCHNMRDLFLGFCLEREGDGARRTEYTYIRPSKLKEECILQTMIVVSLWLTCLFTMITFDFTLPYFEPRRGDEALLMAATRHDSWVTLR